MKKIISLFLCISMLFGIMPGFDVAVGLAEEVSAISENSSLWEWETYGDGVVLTSYNGTQTDVYIPSKVENDGVSYPVIKLGDNLFKDNLNLNSATLAEGICEIGASAFSGAANMVCIVAPQTLTTIGANAFSGCAEFNSVILYDAVTSIGENAFYGCDSLTIYCNENQFVHGYASANGIEYVFIDESAQHDTVLLGGIEYHVANGEAILVQSKELSVSELTIPSTINNFPVTRIYQSAFANCTTLVSVDIPDSVKKIDDSAFSGCTSLNNVSLPNSIIEISTQCFSGCSLLESIDMSSNVTRINSYAFSNCSSLASLTFSDVLEYIGEYAFSGCSALSKLSVPNSVTTICESAFSGCYNIRSLTLSENLTTLGKNAFSGCNGLYSVVVPEKVGGTINAFTNCLGLDTVEILGSVDGVYFSGCENLENVKIHGNVEQFTSSSFSGTFLNYLEVGGNVNLIGGEAFGYKNYMLNELKIGGNVERIATYAFHACSWLDSVTIGGYVNVIEDYAFVSAELAKLEVKGGIANIESQAFYQCAELEYLSVVNYDCVIGSNVFYGCSSLILQVTEGSALHNYAIAYSLNYLIVETPIEIKRVTQNGIVYAVLSDYAMVLTCSTQLSGVVSVPGTVSGKPVTKINASAFQDQRKLTRVILPSSIRTIGASAFRYCSKLTKVNIPYGVERIEALTFDNCPSLEILVVPSTVTWIGNSPFVGCSKMVMFVVENSYAHTYAQNQYPFIFINDNEDPVIRTESNVKYCVSGGKASVIGYANTLSGVITIPSAVGGYPVKTISMNAFKGCNKVTGFNLPDSLESIGASAFYGCSLVENIDIPKSVTKIGMSAFSNCSSLKSVTLPDGLTELPNSLFAYCTSLKSIDIPESVKIVGSAFYNCSALLEVVFPSGVEEIKGNAFEYCTSLKNVVLPEGIETIPSSFFGKCRSLKSVTLPESVKTIQTSAFSGCTSLESVEIPSSLTSIKDYAFDGCTSLKSLYLPATVREIGYKALYNCSSLRELYVPGSVNSINTQTFSGCSNLIIIAYKGSLLLSVAANNSINYYTLNAGDELVRDNGLLYGVSANYAQLILCSDTTKTELTIPETINGVELTAICKAAFKGCNYLSKISIPSGITRIEDDMFVNCYSLKEVDGLKNVTYIGARAFKNCGLRTFALPENLTTIGSEAFYGCSSLETVTLKNKVRSIGSNAFYNCSKLTVFNFNNTYVNNYLTNNSINNILIKDGEDVVEADGIYYHITPSDNSAFVAKCVTYRTGDVDIPETIENCTVKGVHKYAFKNCRNLKNIILPDSVETVGEGAFYGCSSLTGFDVPAGVKSIPLNCFSNCTYLDTVNLSQTLETIGDYAFYNCSKLTDITLPQTVGSIGCYAFANCSLLEEISVPDAVQSLMNNTFENCSSLKNVQLPESITNIGDCAFKGCKKLTTIVLPDSIESIGTYAFANCVALNAVDMPTSTQNISPNLFENCTALKNVKFSENTASIGDYAFYNCSSIEKIMIPDSVVSMGNYAFANCSALKNVEFSKSLQSIGNNCFSNCGQLAYANLYENLINIGSSAFSNCVSLKNIVLPSAIEAINENVFADCTGLERIYFSKSINSIASNAFANDIYAVWYVYGDTYAHRYAADNGLLYYVMHTPFNPEVVYGSSISGTAVYNDSQPASGAGIDLIYDDGTVKKSCVVNSDGSYMFDYAEVGSYTIRVTDSNGYTSTGSVSVKRMSVFDVYIWGDRNLVLKRGYRVSGSLNYDNAKVTISDTSGNIISSMNVSDGTFAFDNIANGEYVIKAETDNASAVEEITVFKSDMSGIVIELQATSAKITGDTLVENRDGSTVKKAHLKAELFDENGTIVARSVTDEDGAYVFENIIPGKYNIVVTTNEMRPDANGGYYREHELKGYSHIDITEPKEYVVETIVLREEKQNLTEFGGKITAKGSTQDCDVFLTDEKGNQISLYTTDSSGFYSFKNIPDGMYCITAVTKKDGMNFSVITIENGTVFGETDIKVEKADKIAKREETLFALSDCNTREEALMYIEVISAEKNFYDSLKPNDKKELSSEWVDLLHRLIALLYDDVMSVSGGVEVSGEESLISSEEILDNESVEFTLTVTETSEVEIDDDGINTKEEYEHQKIKDKGKNKEIIKYYDISLSKNGQEITNIQKHTDTTGKLLITFEIPEEYRGHKHYSFVHVHNGEVQTLVDLDDNPNTVTFEIDKFSTFALAYSDFELTGDVSADDPDTEESANIIYDSDSGMISVTSTRNAFLYIATYNGNVMTNVEIYDVYANTDAVWYEFDETGTAFVWGDNCKPLCRPFSLANEN